MKPVAFSSTAIDASRELADKIKAGLTVEGSSFRETDMGSAYNANLPEGLTKETVKAVGDYNTVFTKAAHVAGGETAAAMFASDKKLTQVTGQIGFFTAGSKLSVRVDHTREFPNPQDKDGDKITKHLCMTMAQEVRGQSAKAIRHDLSEAFKDKFC